MREGDPYAVREDDVRALRRACRNDQGRVRPARPCRPSHCLCACVCVCVRGVLVSVWPVCVHERRPFVPARARACVQTPAPLPWCARACVVYPARGRRRYEKNDDVRFMAFLLPMLQVGLVTALLSPCARAVAQHGCRSSQKDIHDRPRPLGGLRSGAVYRWISRSSKRSRRCCRSSSRCRRARY